ncbi:hypothetical protein [Egbenema bharatensis]|uniref:hypothetical protein n=1 Tax=Egbenema bharatensis TaxID=3463334 RepID=UPI003A8832DD
MSNINRYSKYVTGLRSLNIAIPTDKLDVHPNPKTKPANGSGQRLLMSLHRTQAASVNPLHPNVS